jgi:hypothetical protein
MDRIRRGTKSERGPQVRLFSTLVPHTLPILMIQVERVPLFLLVHKCVVTNEGEEASFYSLRGRFPPSLYMETLATA